MGVKGKRRKVKLEGEPTLLKDINSILNTAQEKGFISKHEVDIEKIIKNEGIELIKDTEMESSLSGSLYKDKDKNNWVIKVNAKHHKKRQRFTMAHEFAHYCLHKDASGTFVDEEVYFRKYHVSSIEYNADSFASEILMPENKFKNAIELENIKSIKTLSDMFNVSTSAILIRAKNLGYKTKKDEE